MPSDILNVQNFMRNLLPGDWDDDVMFSIECSASCKFDMNLSCETINGERITSDTWHVYYFKPNYAS